MIEYIRGAILCAAEMVPFVPRKGEMDEKTKITWFCRNISFDTDCTPAYIVIDDIFSHCGGSSASWCGVRCGQAGSLDLFRADQYDPDHACQCDHYCGRWYLVLVFAKSASAGKRDWKIPQDFESAGNCDNPVFGICLPVCVQHFDECISKFVSGNLCRLYETCRYHESENDAGTGNDRDCRHFWTDCGRTGISRYGIPDTAEGLSLCCGSTSFRSMLWYLPYELGAGRVCFLPRSGFGFCI